MTFFDRVDLWLDGKSMLSASHSGDQKQISRGLRHIIAIASEDRLEEIGDQLLKIKSNFISHMLLKDSKIKKRHKVAAVKSLTKRRTTHILPDFLRDARISIDADCIKPLSPIRRLKALEMFMTGEKVDLTITEEELKELLFPATIDHTSLVVDIKRKFKLKQAKIRKPDMIKLLVAHDTDVMITKGKHVNFIRRALKRTYTNWTIDTVIKEMQKRGIDL